MEENDFSSPWANSFRSKYEEFDNHISVVHDEPVTLVYDGPEMEETHKNLKIYSSILQFAKYLRDETGCGMMLATDCIRRLVDAIKKHPKNRKTDVGYRLKMEWEEFSLRKIEENY